ncbi:DNA repair protein RadA homolog [Desulfosarcina cetonica]|uniref:DNA repair protein RadA n=1 Tax=Desulfosarcina cetonica TaxID=90730 RepID=UPI0006CF357A|nr:DNA repair protein RadA [Desulfosarcina cetonica]VTR69841.1 DNA repair protein RadA homolog [Desulfosarcina cetonica]
MARKIAKTLFVCQACGYESAKWMGRCTECGAWDAFAEEVRKPVTPGNKTMAVKANRPVPIDAVEIIDEKRLSTGIEEFDRVLGGGLVTGTLVLIGGDPGIGKSTLMLQVLHGIAATGSKVLYVSGEESVRQLRLRSRRLETLCSTLLVVSEIDINAVMAMVEGEKPDVLVVDSIQTMFSPEITSAPGSVSQVRESTLRLMLQAKRTGIPTFLVGHVTKEGAIAGPRLLEHMVDTVLYFEGDRNHIFRILRAVKNRFGSTNEIGVFEMKERGLSQVVNPSAVFLSERPENAAGSVVTATMEGTRPILVEIQALAASTSLGTPRRTILGLDANRVALLVAVMEKQLGMHLLGHDIFMNVAGGVKIIEPAVDLGIVSAVASSFLDRPIRKDTLVLGEVGLAGEVRAVGNLEIRVLEAKKMGFSRCVVPLGSLKRLRHPEGIRLDGVDTVAAAVEHLF